MATTTEKPLVTAVLPTYNGAAFIKRTLDSLARQTWPNLEILIGDDRSTDDTLAIVEEFAATHPNTRILERTENLGWLRNTNDLMANAEGEFMFFAFHDDVVSPTYVEKLVGALQDNPRAVLAFSDMQVFEADGSQSYQAFCRLEGKKSALGRGLVMVRLPDNWWVPNRGLFRAGAYRTVGGIHPNEQGEYSADWTWLLHLSLLGEFVRVPEVLTAKYYQRGSLSKTWPHDAAQLAALRKAAVREIEMAPLGLLSKAVLVASLFIRPRLPKRLKRLLPTVHVASQQDAAAGRIELPHRRGWIFRTRAGLRRATVQLSHRIPGPYHRAWLLTDRPDSGNDNAEWLFRYLRDSRPEINAWFVVRQGSADWSRLVRDGYRTRLIAYGGVQWRLLKAAAMNAVSSHTPRDVVWEDPACRHVFLGHGVEQRDATGWLSSFDLDLIMCSTEPEFKAVTSFESASPFRREQVRLTGLPRHDRLLEVSREFGQRDRDLLLLAPSWRKSLCSSQDPGCIQVTPDFPESVYATTWMRVIASPELRSIAERMKLEVALLPHPLAEPGFTKLGMQDSVTLFSYSGGDVQTTLARAAVLITDYSSVAFDVAYIGRPVIYYQFDQDDVISGGAHTLQPGYFDYYRDGFGPVVRSHVELMLSVRALAEKEFESDRVYQERADRTFAFRDGQCCARVARVIEDLDTMARASGQQQRA